MNGLANIFAKFPPGKIITFTVSKCKTNLRNSIDIVFQFRLIYTNLSDAIIIMEMLREIRGEHV